MKDTPTEKQTEGYDQSGNTPTTPAAHNGQEMSKYAKGGENDQMRSVAPVRSSSRLFWGNQIRGIYRANYTTPSAYGYATLNMLALFMQIFVGELKRLV